MDDTTARAGGHVQVQLLTGRANLGGLAACCFEADQFLLCAGVQQNGSRCPLPLGASLCRTPSALLIISNPPCGCRDKKKLL